MKSYFLSALLLSLTITELTGTFDLESSNSTSEFSDYSLGSFAEQVDYSRAPASPADSPASAEHITELTGTFK